MSYYQDINGGIYREVDVAAIDTNELSRLFEQAHYEGKQFDELDPDSSAYPRERLLAALHGSSFIVAQYYWRDARELNDPSYVLVDSSFDDGLTELSDYVGEAFAQSYEAGEQAQEREREAAATAKKAAAEAYNKAFNEALNREVERPVSDR
jgi:hypothetical protein